MKPYSLAGFAILTSTVCAGSANAQFPNDNVSSDACYNTAVGSLAMGSETAGCASVFSTAVGYKSLYANQGLSNIGIGYLALEITTSGSYNIAIGTGALDYNVTGSDNVAVGVGALNNSLGGSNTAVGFHTVQFNNGNYNTALGAQALSGTFETSSGSNNSAVGYQALTADTTGYDNAASGSGALYSNTTGSKNLADGVNALYVNTAGNNNTALGVAALVQNTSGSTNIAIGYHGGGSLTTGSNNIDIGSAGVAAESGIIRIGTAGTQTQTYIAGIDATQITGSAVYVTSSGELGVLASSERYKTAIASMGEATDKLQQLRPVSFHLKTEPAGALQYGLIAEEVAQVYPELVIRDAAGTIQGVRYDELAPMLLNEVQQQATQLKDMQRLSEELHDTRRQLSELQAQVSTLTKASAIQPHQ